MARRIEIDANGGGITALTIDDACTAATADRSLSQYAGVTTNNKWEEIITDAALDNDKARLTAGTNSSTSSREGYGIIKYVVNGTTCEKIIHIVQAAGSASGDFKLTINVPQGKTSPAIRFLDASNNILFSHTRSNGVVGELSTWSRTGTCTKMGFVENGSNLTLVTLMNNNGTSIIYRQPLNPGTTQTIIDLTQSFNTSDYSNGNKTLSLTFS